MNKIIILSLISLSLFSCKDKEKDTVEEPVNTIATEGAGVYDIDSNFYKTTIITKSGEWMAENLKTSHYSTGDTIMSGRNLDDISGLSQPSFFFYSNGDSSSVNKYGRLYTYYVVDNGQGLCPTGWHVPTKSEWDTLKFYLGGQEIAGAKMKGSDFWSSPNTGADNKSLFNAKPAGFRTPEEVYSEISQTAIFWTSTADVGNKSWSYYLKYNYPTLFQVPSEGNLGLSVRCKRD